jgi:hypothetical protein
MRFTSQVQLQLPGIDVLRAPTFWEDLASMLGRSPDLRTGVLETARDVLGIVEAVSRALAHAGVTNAVLLEVDGRSLYRDTVGYGDDAPWLLEGARQGAPHFARGFRMLRALFEHEAGGVRTLVEATFPARYSAGRAATLSLGGRLTSLRPRAGEGSDAARAVACALLSDPRFVTDAAAQFAALAQRVREGLRWAFPDAQVLEEAPIAQVVKPARGSVQALAAASFVTTPALRTTPTPPPRGTDALRYYDPWTRWIEDPQYTWVELVALDAMLRGVRGHPLRFALPIHVVYEAGTVLCEADVIGTCAGGLRGVSRAAEADWDRPSPTDWLATETGYDDAYGVGDPEPDPWPADGHRSHDSPYQHHEADGSGATDGAHHGHDAHHGSTDCSSSDCTTDCSSTDCTTDCSSSDCSTDCCSSDCSSSDCTTD